MKMLADKTLITNRQFNNINLCTDSVNYYVDVYYDFRLFTSKVAYRYNSETFIYNITYDHDSKLVRARLIVPRHLVYLASCIIKNQYDGVNKQMLYDTLSELITKKAGPMASPNLLFK